MRHSVRPISRAAQPASDAPAPPANPAPQRRPAHHTSDPTTAAPAATSAAIALLVPRPLTVYRGTEPSGGGVIVTMVVVTAIAAAPAATSASTRSGFRRKPGAAGCGPRSTVGGRPTGIWPVVRATAGIGAVRSTGGEVASTTRRSLVSVGIRIVAVVAPADVAVVAIGAVTSGRRAGGGGGGGGAAGTSRVGSSRDLAAPTTGTSPVM